jgi:mevalonate kinase
MTERNIVVSAPGKLFLLGEHAVLHGRRALVCAVNQRLRVTLQPRSGTAVHLRSALGEWHGSLAELGPREPFRFVLAAIGAAGPAPSGFEMDIRSDFSPLVGLGSSAAVTVAVMAALDRWRGYERPAGELCRAATEVVRAVQSGAASGADVAASIYGGLLSYRAAPFEVLPLGVTHPITVVYSGHKTPTPEAIARVEARRVREPEVVAAVFDAMDHSVGVAAAAAVAGEWTRVGEILTMNQGLMGALGVSSPTLEALVSRVAEAPGIMGAKLSGAGLGDCIVGLGQLRSGELLSEQVLPVDMSEKGLVIDDHGA